MWGVPECGHNLVGHGLLGWVWFVHSEIGEAILTIQLIKDRLWMGRKRTRGLVASLELKVYKAYFFEALWVSCANPS